MTAPDPLPWLDQLDARAPDNPELWSLWVSRRSNAVPKLTAAVRAVLALADELDGRASAHFGDAAVHEDAYERGRKAGRGDVSQYAAARLRAVVATAIGGEQ